MSKQASDKNSIPWKWIIIAVVLIAITAAWFLLPVDQWIKALRSWVDGLGAWGYVIFGLIYVVATLALAPGAVFSLAAGLIFGAWGFAVVIVAATLAACLAFLVARHLARERVRKAIEHRPRFKAVDKAVSEDGWKIVALLRLSPAIPFNLQNYFFGVTDIGLGPYALATFLGIIPGTALYVYLGVLGGMVGSGGGSGSVLKWVLLGVGLVATVVVTVLISRKAAKKLDEAETEDQQDGADDS